MATRLTKFQKWHKENQWLKVYGDLTLRLPLNKVLPEGNDQASFFNYVRNNKSYGWLATHIENEGKEQRARSKVQGMVVGASDIVIPCKIPFVCELKRLDHSKSKIHQKQLNYLKIAHEHGAFACIALGYENAKQALMDWEAACNA